MLKHGHLNIGLNMSDCRWCQAKHSHIYDYACYGCRQRALLDEPCKVLREYMANNMWRNGEVPEWRIEPNCGCKKSCKRRQLTKRELRIN